MGLRRRHTEVDLDAVFTTAQVHVSVSIKKNCLGFMLPLTWKIFSQGFQCYTLSPFILEKIFTFVGKLKIRHPQMHFTINIPFFFYIWEVLYEYYFQSIKSKAKLQVLGLQLVHFTVRIITL